VDRKIEDRKMGIARVPKFPRGDLFVINLFVDSFSTLGFLTG
jgi:hypothetical protein